MLSPLHGLVFESINEKRKKARMRPKNFEEMADVDNEEIHADEVRDVIKAEHEECEVGKPKKKKKLDWQPQVVPQLSGENEDERAQGEMDGEVPEQA